MKLVENDNEEYYCDLCENKDDNEIKQDLKLRKAKLGKLDQLLTIQESITFLSKQFDDILKGIVENKTIVEEIKKKSLLQRKNK